MTRTDQSIPKPVIEKRIAELKKEVSDISMIMNRLKFDDWDKGMKSRLEERIREKLNQIENYKKEHIHHIM